MTNEEMNSLEALCKSNTPTAAMAETLRAAVPRLISAINDLRFMNERLFKIADTARKLYINHNHDCDVFEVSPQLGPSTKPCNCGLELFDFAIRELDQYEVGNDNTDG
jgi:hypothetical protein